MIPELSNKCQLHDLSVNLMLPFTLTDFLGAAWLVVHVGDVPALSYLHLFILKD